MKLSAIVCCLVLALSADALCADVPPEIARQIKESVATKHPDNYTLQKILVDGHVSAYQWIEKLNHVENVPNDVLAKIKSKVQEAHPGNYTLQKILIEGQIKAYLDLNR